MGAGYENLQMDANFTEIESQVPLGVFEQPVVLGGAPVTGISAGGGGTVTGPTITITSGAPGFNFVASGSTLTFQITNPAAACTALGAARLGNNNDITKLLALVGNAGVHPWTGTPNGASQSTYPATVASAAYVQAELQAVMDKLQQTTEFLMFLVTALSNPGLVKP
jgi:hypothetical protein